jgi:hypothetical protein
MRELEILETPYCNSTFYLFLSYIFARVYEHVLMVIVVMSVQRHFQEGSH